MTVYTWMIILLLSAALLLNGNRKGNVKFILIAFLLLFAVMGLRDVNTVGTDSLGRGGSYPVIFRRCGRMAWQDLSGNGEENFNIGFVYLTKLLYIITDGNYQMYVTIIMLFVSFSYMRFIKRYSPSPIQSVLYFLGLLYFSFHFNALKQSVAMVFVLYSFDAVIDRKLLRFLILMACASVFHYPALVFLPAYWIGNMRLGRSYLILLVVIMVVVYYLRDDIVQWMNDAYYGEEADHTVATTARFLMNKVIVMLIIIAAALVIRPPHPSDRVYCAFLALIGIATVLQTFAAYGNVFERLADYYFQFAIVFIPMVFENVKTERRYLGERELKMVCRVGPYVFGAFAIWRFLSAVVNDPSIYPYQFYFQAEKAQETLSALMHF